MTRLFSQKFIFGILLFSSIFLPGIVFAQAPAPNPGDQPVGPLITTEDPYAVNTRGIPPDVQEVCYAMQLGRGNTECALSTEPYAVCRKRIMEQCFEDEIARTATVIQPTTINTSRSNTTISQVSAGLRQLNQFKNLGSANEAVARAVSLFMGVLGMVALIMFIYGGLLWMFSRGNSEQVSKAIKILVWSALGVVVILSSYILVDFIFNAFTPST